MSVLKDLFYTKGNAALDISRVCVGLSILAFWGGVFYHEFDKHEFDAQDVGLGIAAIFAGGAGWIHMRQKHEETPDAAQ